MAFLSPSHYCLIVSHREFVLKKKLKISAIVNDFHVLTVSEVFMFCSCLFFNCQWVRCQLKCLHILSHVACLEKLNLESECLKKKNQTTAVRPFNLSLNISCLFTVAALNTVDVNTV